jgi:hypothetical protein
MHKTKKNPYCCILHNLPKISIFFLHPPHKHSRSCFFCSFLSLSPFFSVKYWQLHNTLLNMIIERETTKNILLLTPFMAFLLTIFLRLPFFSKKKNHAKRNFVMEKFLLFLKCNAYHYCFDCFFFLLFLFCQQKASIKKKNRA